MSPQGTEMTTEAIRGYLVSNCLEPLFLHGDAAQVCSRFPSESVDFCMTSPPYWGQRKYSTDGIGLEDDWNDYLRALLDVFAEVHRVLKPTGSFWLNIGDVYSDKHLLGLPWRLVFRLTDEQGWILRNDVIWHKVKGGPDNSKDRLRNVHEYVFHFTKTTKGYYYDVDAIRKPPAQARIVNGAVVSATGVHGVRYRRQIELSTQLTGVEKQEALAALEDMLAQVKDGRISDFRMIIRGAQRATHSDQESVSGRARELRERGYYFLRYHPAGAKPGDVWDILPEDTQGRKGHFAPYPQDLCRIPLLATCPLGGIAIDPFCGTGTTASVAFELGRKSIGIDRAEEYVQVARDRLVSRRNLFDAAG